MNVCLGHARIIKLLLDQLLLAIFLPYVFIDGKDQNVIPGRVGAASRRVLNCDDHMLHGVDGIGNVRVVRSMEKICDAPQGMLEIRGVNRTSGIKGKIIW
jgi:hypothetical protein